MQPDWIDQHVRQFDFPESGGDIRHTIYIKGEGPPIVILQELPGIGVETFALADRLIAAGFKVYLPHLVGELGVKDAGLPATLRRVFCIRREFQMFRVGRQSEIASWLRALCAEIQQRESGSQIGLIGMCLTGSFAIPLMAEDAVAAAVASQPSLPFIFRTSQLHMSEDDVDRACAAMKEKGPALVMRYKSDTISTTKHIDALTAAFGDTLQVEQYDNPDGDSGKLHSLLTLHFSQPAYAKTEPYFKSRFGMN